MTLSVQEVAIGALPAPGTLLLSEAAVEQGRGLLKLLLDEQLQRPHGLFTACVKQHMTVLKQPCIQFAT